MDFVKKRVAYFKGKKTHEINTLENGDTQIFFCDTFETKTIKKNNPDRLFRYMDCLANHKIYDVKIK